MIPYVFFGAPTHRLIPISFVLFDTDIYIIFITPTPAKNIDIDAIAQKNKGKTTYKAVYARAAMKLFSKNMYNLIRL